MKFTAEMFENLARTAHDPDAAQKAADILNGDLDPKTVDAVDQWVRQCFTWPGLDEMKMAALNALLDCYGVEALRVEGAWDSYHGDAVASYLNTGDTYTETVLLDHDTGEFTLTTYGDWLEAREAVA